MSNAQRNAHNDEIERDADDGEGTIDDGVLGITTEKVYHDKDNARGRIHGTRLDENDDNRHERWLVGEVRDFACAEPNTARNEGCANNIG